LLVHQFTNDNNIYFEFHPSFFYVKNPSSGVILLQGPSKNGIYPPHTLTSPSTSPTSYLSKRVSVPQWHTRLGHPALRTAKAILSKFHLAVTNNKYFPVNHACQLGKSHKLPFHLLNSVSSSPFKLIFMDIWGPLPTKSIYGNKYYLSIINDFSKFIWLFLIDAKSQIAHTFINFQLQIERYFNCKIKTSKLILEANFRP
jgi:histone deacetylase 1/2